MRSRLVSLLLLSGFAAGAQTQQQALRALEQEKFGQAKSMFSSLIKANPAAAENFYYLGEIYFDNARKDSAKYFFQKGIVANPQTYQNYIGMGQIALEADNMAEAQKNFDKAITLAGPKESTAPQLIAEAYITASNKKATQALTVINKAIENDPKNAELYVTLGDVYLEQGNGGQAISNYEKALSFNKNFPKASDRIGQLYSRARNFQEALSAYQNAIKMDAEYSPAYRNLAELYYQWKKFDLAIETYKKYMSLSDPNNMNSKSRLASFLFLNKNYEESSSLINEVMKKDSSNIIMKRLLGYSYFEQKNYEQSLRYLDNFFKKVDPKKIIASDYEYYGKALSKMNKDSMAILNFKKGLELDNTKTDLYNEIAASYNKLKNYNEAAKYFELKFANTRPTSADYFLLGKTYYFAQNFPKCDSVFTKLIELQPKWHPAYLWKGRVQDKLDTKEPKAYLARPFYDKVIELASLDAAKNKNDLIEAYNYLGVQYIQTDDKANAKLTYQKILELDPENKDAKEYLKRLK